MWFGLLFHRYSYFGYTLFPTLLRVKLQFASLIGFMRFERINTPISLQFPRISRGRSDVVPALDTAASKGGMVGTLISELYRTSPRDKHLA